MSCKEFGFWTKELGTQFAPYVTSGQITNANIPAPGIKITPWDGNPLWNLGVNDPVAGSKILSVLFAAAPPQDVFELGCDCKFVEEPEPPVEKDECCDYGGVYAGLGLVAAVVFERIEMGKKVRGDDNKHGMALGLVLGILLLMIISGLGESVSAIWLLVMAAVVFIGMSLIQGKFMKQYPLNKRPAFSDFSSDIAEAQLEQSFFTRRDSSANVAF
jgi:hypothetical protein